MNPIFGLFAIGTISFWFLLAVEAIALLAWIEFEYAGWATFSLLVTFGLLQLGGAHLCQYILQNPAVIGYGALIYFGAGTAWSVIKWYFFTKSMRRKYDEFKAEWLKEQGIVGTVIPDEQKSLFQEDVRNATRYNEFEVRPQVSAHKARIYLWMAYWPASALWTIINDPIKRAFNEIYLLIRGMLQRISDYAWAGTEGDLTPIKVMKKEEND